MADKTISIGFKVDGGADGLNTLTVKAGDLRKAVEATVKETQRLKDKTESFASLSVGIDSITRTIGDLQRVMGELSDAYAVQIEAETKLQTVMRERMSASEADIQSIKDLCSAQQQLGVIGDEVQLAGAQQMATFLNTRGALETLIPAMNNLTAQQKGFNATSSDTTNIANLMGKAMMGQTAALRRAGITFNEAEEKAIKYGTEQERAAALAKVIEKNVGNMNEALAKTPAGQMKQLSNAVGDFAEKLGSYVQQWMPMITMMNTTVTAGLNVWKISSQIGGAMKAMFGIIRTQCTPASTSITVLGKSFTYAGVQSKVMASLVSGALRAVKIALISTGVGLAVVALGEAIGAITEKLTGVKQAANDAADGIKEMADGQNAENEAMQNATAQIQKHIAELKNWTGSKEEERKKVQELNGTYGELMGTLYTVKDWYDKLTESAELYAQQAVLAARAELVARRLAQSQESLNDFKKKYGDGTPPKGTTGDPKWNIKPIVNTGAIISGAQKNIDDAQKDLADIYAEMAENAKKLKTGKPAGAGAGSGGGSRTAPELIPEGSIEYYQRKISELEKQIKLAVDPQSMAVMTAQVEEFKKKIARIEFEVWWMPRKDKWDDFYEELQDDAKKDPVTIPVKAKVETPQLTLDTSQFTKGVGTATDDSEALQKNLSRIADVARNAGSAFSSMGQAMESKELNIAGIVAQAIANIVAGYASATAQESKGGIWAWIAASVSGLATTLAMISQIKNVTAFASGGIVSGPTMALVGEYAGASNNPEVIAPLDKLRGLLPEPDGIRRIEVTGRLRGSDIELCLAHCHRVGMASGRKSKI